MGNQHGGEGHCAGEPHQGGWPQLQAAPVLGGHVAGRLLQVADQAFLGPGVHLPANILRPSGLKLNAQSHL